MAGVFLDGPHAPVLQELVTKKRTGMRMCGYMKTTFSVSIVRQSTTNTYEYFMIPNALIFEYLK